MGRLKLVVTGVGPCCLRCAWSDGERDLLPSRQELGNAERCGGDLAVASGIELGPASVLDTGRGITAEANRGRLTATAAIRSGMS